MIDYFLHMIVVGFSSGTTDPLFGFESSEQVTDSSAD